MNGGSPLPRHKHLLSGIPATYCRVMMGPSLWPGSSTRVIPAGRSTYLRRVPVRGHGHWTLWREQGLGRLGLFPRPSAGHVGGVAGPQPGLCTATQLAALLLREGLQLGKQTPETSKTRLKSSSRNKPRARVHTLRHRHTHPKNKNNAKFSLAQLGPQHLIAFREM